MIYMNSLNYLIIKQVNEYSRTVSDKKITLDNITIASYFKYQYIQVLLFIMVNV